MKQQEKEVENIVKKQCQELVEEGMTFSFEFVKKLVKQKSTSTTTTTTSPNPSPSIPLARILKLSVGELKMLLLEKLKINMPIEQIRLLIQLVSSNKSNNNKKKESREKNYILGEDSEQFETVFQKLMVAMLMEYNDNHNNNINNKEYDKNNNNNNDKNNKKNNNDNNNNSNNNDINIAVDARSLLVENLKGSFLLQTKFQGMYSIYSSLFIMRLFVSIRLCS